MANITAKDVASLRERTGVGMMDCKKALVEADGDVEKAIVILREKGLATQAKKAGRVAAEGLVVAMVEGNVGVVVEVNSETDFVANTDQFKNFCNMVAKTIIECNPADVDALKACKASGSDKTVEEELQEVFLQIRENIQIRRFTRMEGTLVAYIHGEGRIGVMVKMDTDLGEKAYACGKDCALQIAAMNPAYLDRTKVPADVLENEKMIMHAQMAEDPKMANKPAAVLEKIVEGKVGKYYSENCLVDQEFVKDGDFTVGKYVEKCAKELGGSIKVVDYVRYERGEGIAKKTDNFADEVASMIK
ncbi:MAG TPA: elongation factor Ts [Candidatus Faeciplasma pullistercoris]|uniref:Elongation factor Ts n=1 Tax=Candidatus Faeciplasma pullistercoris TaxID=2840800 RepID=A0A9D1KJT5_9FIRM|nr:elongation factor Ts [Candidatus Faeciplasma pullistercoris]